MEYVLDDDTVVAREDVTVDLLDRGFLFGDGVYDLIGFHDGVPFSMDRHLSRLASSAEKISLRLPVDLETLEGRLMELAAANGLGTGFVYVQVTRGSAPRTHRFPDGAPTPRVIAFATRSERLPQDHYDEGVTAMLLEDMRWSRCDIKSLNLLPNVLAKQQAFENGCFEAILHRDGDITEGSSSNVLAVKDGRVHTRPADNLILNGVTRQTVLELCREGGVDVVEEVFDRDFLLGADEVFLSVTFLGIISRPAHRRPDARRRPGDPGRTGGSGPADRPLHRHGHRTQLICGGFLSSGRVRRPTPRSGASGFVDGVGGERVVGDARSD